MTGRRPRPSGTAKLVFSLLLWLYPRGHRRRFGAEMRQFFVDESVAREAAEGRRGRMGFLLRVYGRLILGGVGAHIDSFVRPRRKRARRWRAEGIHRTRQTVRHAGRRLLRSPGYALTSALTLALGIGACTVIYSVLYPVLVAPLPYPESNRLVALYELSPGPEGSAGWVSPLTFRDWTERSQRLDGIASWRLSLLTWTGDGEPSLLRGWAVSAGFFPVLGLKMALGRSFTADEDRYGSRRVVVISSGLWHRSFGADPEVIGRSMTLDGEPYTIVGVASAAVEFPSPGEYWVPLAVDHGRELRDFRYLGVIGRLRPGSALDDARAEFEEISRRVAIENPDTNTGWGARVVSLKDDQVGRIRPILLGLAGAVALLLLIAMGNVANLSVARAVDREAELAVRRALGASRRDLIGGLVAEITILSVVGASLGAAAAYEAIGPVRAALGDIPAAAHVAVDARALVFSLGVALAVGLTLGLLAALLPGRRALAEVLRGGGGRGTASAGTHRTRAVVLTAQVALALTLVIGGSLLARSLVSMTRLDVGFDPRGLLSFGYQLPVGSYEDDASVRDFHARALARITALPGVQAAGAVTPVPLEMGSVPSPWFLSADARSPSDPPAMAHMRTVTSGYREAMGLRLLSGRFLEASDREDAPPVAVVNASFVSRYLGGRDPVGVRVSPGEPSPDESDWLTIVGVVGDVRFRSLTAGGEPEIYLPEPQVPSRWGHLVVRASGRRGDIVRAVTDAVHSVDPDLPVSDMRSGEEMIARQLRTSRLVTVLSGLFAAAAAALAVVGILGLLSLVVARRVKELGLRMVLGAPAGSIRWFILGRGMKPVLTGLALGIAASLAASSFLDAPLRGMVSSRDPLAYILATLIFAAVSALACVIPGVRATHADPLSLMRSE